MCSTDKLRHCLQHYSIVCVAEIKIDFVICSHHTNPHVIFRWIFNSSIYHFCFDFKIIPFGLYLWWRVLHSSNLCLFGDSIREFGLLECNSRQVYEHSSSVWLFGMCFCCSGSLSCTMMQMEGTDISNGWEDWQREIRNCTLLNWYFEQCGLGSAVRIFVTKWSKMPHTCIHMTLIIDCLHN